MEKQVLFTETQRFRQWWFWLILMIVIGIPVVALLQKGLKQHYNWHQYLIFANAAALVVPLLLGVFVLICRLDTQITNDHIRARFFPVHLKFQSYPQETIGLAVVRKYDPIGEYGGWGFRLGLFGKGKAFNVSGNQGIQLVFKDGSKLLIGTQKPDEATLALKHFLPKKE